MSFKSSEAGSRNPREFGKPERRSLNPFTRAKQKAEAQIAEMARQQDQAALDHQWAIEQERQRHQQEIDRKNEQMRREYRQRMEEQARADELLRRQQEDHRRKMESEQIANERRWQAEQAARADQERRIREEHERMLAVEKEKADRLAKERRERERREQLEREREKQRREDRLKRLRMTSPESLRALRELIRRKYELDMSIWADRKVRGPLRPDVLVKMEQADAAYMEIRTIVKSWGNNKNGTWNQHEWPLAREVQERILANVETIRVWEGRPPWEED